MATHGLQSGSLVNSYTQATKGESGQWLHMGYKVGVWSIATHGLQRGSLVNSYTWSTKGVSGQ